MTETKSNKQDKQDKKQSEERDMKLQQDDAFWRKQKEAVETGDFVRI